MSAVVALCPGEPAWCVVQECSNYTASPHTILTSPQGANALSSFPRIPTHPPPTPSDPYSRLRIKALNCPSCWEVSAPRIWSDEARGSNYKYLISRRKISSQLSKYCVCYRIFEYTKGWKEEKTHVPLLAAAVTLALVSKAPLPTSWIRICIFPRPPAGLCAYSSLRSPELDNPTTTLEFLS